MVLHTTNKDFVLGILYLLYGLVKVAIGVFLIFAPPKIIKDSYIMKFLLKESEDSTLAGRMYEYMLCIFGLFTIMLGLALLNLLPDNIRNLVITQSTEFTVMTCIGTILIVFYSLVLYTNLPIPKQKSRFTFYKFIGLGTGIYFILIPIFIHFLKSFLPTFKKLSIQEQSVYGLGIVLILFVIGDFLYKLLKKNNIPLVSQEYVNLSKDIESSGIVITKKTVASFNNN